MATKLKNLRLTSVDLVRNGANQEADICLFKSADTAEAVEQPTERETNILKRFINWLMENHTEGEYEPENPVEKADTQSDIADIYKSAITESLQSIATDDSLSAIEKSDMIAKSLGEYHDAMVELLVFGEDSLAKSDEEETEMEGDEEEVEKFNQNHDELGRFASGSGGGATIAGTGGGVNTSGKPAFASTTPKFNGNGDAKITVTRGTMGKDWTEQKITINSGLKKVTEDAISYEGMDKAGNAYTVKYRRGADGKADFSRCDVIEKSFDIDEIEEV